MLRTCRIKNITEFRLLVLTHLRNSDFLQIRSPITVGFVGSILSATQPQARFSARSYPFSTDRCRNYRSILCFRCSAINLGRVHGVRMEELDIMNRAFAYYSLLTNLSFQPEATQHWRSLLDLSGIRRSHHFLLNHHVPIDWLGQ